MAVDENGEAVETGPSIEPSGYLARFFSELRWKAARLRRRWIPSLVWAGDEVDVHIHFKQIGALGGVDTGCILEVQELLGKMGVSFDSGSGWEGRDWEWDWSLSGPVSVSFRGRSRRPERRLPRPKLRLVSSV